MLFAISQSVTCVSRLVDISLHVDTQTQSRFFVISLVFWYGARLVSTLEYSNFQFFVGLMVRALALQ
jgi:hypothetical protein